MFFSIYCALIFVLFTQFICYRLLINCILFELHYSFFQLAFALYWKILLFLQTRLHTIFMSPSGIYVLLLFVKLGVMKSNVESRLKNYEQDLQKFESRWHQLKPSDALLDDDPSAGEQAVQLIKEKKQEFEELETTREALEYASHHIC